MAYTTYNPDGSVKAVTGNLNTELGRTSLAQLGATSPVPQVTDASRLGSSAIQVPTPINSNVANTQLGATVDSVVNGLPQQAGTITAETQTNGRDQQLTRIGGLLEKLGLKGTRTAEVNQEQGVFEKQQAVTDLENKLRSTDLAYRRQIEDIQANKQGKFGGAVEQDVAEVSRLANREKADIAIQLQAANGNYQTAFNIAEAKIKAEFEPLQDEINNRMSLYNAMANDLTDKEKLQMQEDINKRQQELNYQYDLKLTQEKAKIEQASPLYQAQVAKLNQEISDNNIGGGITTPEGITNAGKYSGALSVILGSANLTKEQKKAVINAVNNGQDPVAVIKNQAKNVMGQTLATSLDKSETAKAQLQSIDTLLKDYYARGGNTNVFSGNFEKTINKLGEVKDPELVEIATNISSALQIYRNAVSGTAYSVQEGKEISSVFPGINKSEGLNQAIINGRIRAFDTTIDASYRNTLGSTYDSIKSASPSVNKTETPLAPGATGSTSSGLKFTILPLKPL